jgi:hypothetical protein
MFKAVSERAKELTLSNSGSGLTLKPIVTLMETGCPTGFCHSTLHVTLQITSADGAVLDEVQFESSHGNNVFEATDERRMRADGENVGKAMAKYLKSRVAGQ